MIAHQKPSSWIEVLIGLLPMLVYGLVSVIILLLDGAQSNFNPGLLIWLVVGLTLQLTIALTVLHFAWDRGFPRWSYAYLGVVLVTVSLVISEILYDTLYFPFHDWYQKDNQFIRNSLYGLMLTVGSISVTFLVVQFTRLNLTLQSLSHGLQQDWTQLSFGLFLMLTMFSHSSGGPDPSPWQLLPAIILVLGALAYLRSTSQSQRLLTLAGSWLLVTLTRLLLGGILALPSHLALGIILFLPALLIRPANEPSVSSSP